MSAASRWSSRADASAASSPAPGYPECTFTKPLVIAMPGRCPKCGERILKKTSRNGYAYYGCENNNNKDESKRCDFMTWDVPVADDCPTCGQTMFKKSGKGFKKPFCINEQCANFTPEEKRGGYRKKTETAAEGENAQAQDASGKKEKKTTAKKSTAAKKTAEKKTTAKKTTAARKETAKKPAKKSTKQSGEETV